ncbi:uncharacterized protein LOC129238450 [Anastrepha obliqua]|uniref:uncharacterized protein LOC129238450 n=1 Tax=Anastrepha obliqua TaxID=95512 RepID=UPI002409D47A|nr:uncharacterized protein LOC129238450 [Anastrepha obliqua]
MREGSRGDYQKPTPLSVSIDGCSSLPCEAVAGERFLMAVQFLATKDTTSELSAEVIIKTSSGIKVPFALDEEERNVCGNLLHGAYCPLYATEDATYNLTMQLPNFSGRNIVEVNLVDESENEVIACFTTEILIKRISKKFRI